MKQPIRYQLLMPLLAVLVVASVGIAGCTAWLNWSRQMTSLRDRQDKVIRVVEEAAFPLTAAVLKQLSQLCGQQLVVWEPGTTRIVETSLDHVPDDLAQRIVQARSIPVDARDGGSLELGGERFSIRNSRLQRHVGLEVVVLTSRRSLDEARWDALWPPLALEGGALLLLIPWLLALTRNWSRRIEEIQRTVADVANGTLTTPPNVDERDDELSALMADIHRMSRRLRELQAELLQAERQHLVAQMAAGFAHQFRNGVAGASLALQLHASRCGRADEKSLLVAQKQLGLLEAEIRGMLSLARRAESPLELVPASALIDEAIELVMPSVAHKQITLRCDSPPVSAVIHGSRDGLRSALLNLLLNAIDAAGPGGEIQVAAKQADSGLIIAIRDSGLGPSPEVAPRMMEAFVTTKSEGIGLGLTVVAAVAQDHGGRLNWRREEGWTVVELWLPLPGQKL